MRFSLIKVSGSLGDLGTFVPLILAVTLSTGMDLGLILLLAGLANVATGLFWGLPVPVQPMQITGQRQSSLYANGTTEFSFCSTAPTKTS